MCEQSQPQTPRLFSLTDAAEYIGIPSRTLWQLCIDGKLPAPGAVRIGSKWWLKAETVEKIASEGVPVSDTPGEIEAATLETQTPDINDPRR